MVVAVEPVTQPPQVKPKIARATAPPTAPQRAGLTLGEMFMIFPFKEREGKRSPKNQVTIVQDPQSLLLYKTAHSPHFSFPTLRAKMCQMAINIAAITGPNTKPLMPKTEMPPRVEIRTT